ncbi:hypothetical protein Y032_0034g2826 [Ancylostoma ceylanicum]|uniref:Peptidase C2 calpain large subunit domain-containing protein n=1 Tax=Ancylostoma ceylanicum TaxID=53326 RepID=A0A016UL94_9BILA|nr:hypothetical protein Y032_0034g2826 [Ancylostoma ceylanicum]
MDDLRAKGAAHADFLLDAEAVVETNPFSGRRQATCRFRVPAGKYIILPCTLEPNCEGEFLLRIYVNGKLQTSRLQ